jgi:hypothetical protein
LAHLSNTWKNEAEFNGDSTGDDVPFLNAEVTTWNLRDKKIAGKPMTFLRNKSFIFDAGRQHFIPIYEQSKFKYILYVEGHCAANRYAFLMRLGSVILKVTSRCVADEMWYYPILKPFEDHVPIREDLSDLAEKIQWCRDNDDKCRQIAARANELYERFVSKEAIHDYMEVICNRVAQRFEPPPQWYNRPTEVETVKKPFFGRPRSVCVNGANARHCNRCQELKQEEEERSHRSSRDESDRGRRSYASSHGDDRHNNSRREDRGYGDRNDHHDRYGGGSNRSRDRSRDRHGGGSSYRGGDSGGGSRSYDNGDQGSKRQRASTVAQCRKCRRPKTACSCSYRH